jgi:hypothetical protein
MAKKQAAGARKVARKTARKSSTAGAAPKGRALKTSRDTSERQRVQKEISQQNPGTRRRGDALDQRDSQTSEVLPTQLSEGRRGSTRAATVDEIRKEQGKVDVERVTAHGQIDHAALNHPREEHEHRVANLTRARVEAPTPRDITKITDQEQIAEMLRLETKADNLYFWRDEQERKAEKPRQPVIDAINARLREVQGDPILT